jgi:hypothetical protein
MPLDCCCDMLRCLNILTLRNIAKYVAFLICKFDDLYVALFYGKYLTWVTRFHPSNSLFKHYTRKTKRSSQGNHTTKKFLLEISICVLKHLWTGCVICMSGLFVSSLCIWSCHHIASKWKTLQTIIQYCSTSDTSYSRTTVLVIRLSPPQLRVGRHCTRVVMAMHFHTAGVGVKAQFHRTH